MVQKLKDEDFTNAFKNAKFEVNDAIKTYIDPTTKQSKPNREVECIFTLSSGTKVLITLNEFYKDQIGNDPQKIKQAIFEQLKGSGSGIGNVNIIKGNSAIEIYDQAKHKRGLLDFTNIPDEKDKNVPKGLIAVSMSFGDLVEKAFTNPDKALQLLERQNTGLTNLKPIKLTYSERVANSYYKDQKKLQNAEEILGAALENMKKSGMEIGPALKKYENEHSRLEKAEDDKKTFGKIGVSVYSKPNPIEPVTIYSAVMEYQKLMKDAKIYKGKVDGFTGNMTALASSRFEKKLELAEKPARKEEATSLIYELQTKKGIYVIEVSNDSNFNPNRFFMVNAKIDELPRAVEERMSQFRKKVLDGEVKITGPGIVSSPNYANLFYRQVSSKMITSPDARFALQE